MEFSVTAAGIGSERVKGLRGYRLVFYKTVLEIVYSFYLKRNEFLTNKQLIYIKNIKTLTSQQ